MKVNNFTLILTLTATHKGSNHLLSVSRCPEIIQPPMTPVDTNGYMPSATDAPPQGPKKRARRRNKSGQRGSSSRTIYDPIGYYNDSSPLPPMAWFLVYSLLHPLLHLSTRIGKCLGQCEHNREPNRNSDSQTFRVPKIFLLIWELILDNRSFKKNPK